MDSYNKERESWHKEIKSHDRLFFSCTFLGSCLQEWKMKCGIVMCFGSCLDSFACLNAAIRNKESKALIRLLFNSLIYSIWKTRNEVTFRAAKPCIMPSLSTSKKLLLTMLA
ncbi:hypothetical protein Droror1_Dr00024887 [Drosera rotundifolia]